MKPYKIEAGTAQHIGNRPQQNDRTALFTGAHSPGYVMAVLADGIAGGALASEQVLHTAKQLFDEFKPGDNPTLERLAELLREIVHETHMVIKMNGVASQTEPHCTFVGLVITPRQASELLINKAIERAQGKGGNCTMAIVKLVKPPREE